MLMAEHSQIQVSNSEGRIVFIQSMKYMFFFRTTCLDWQYINCKLEIKSSACKMRIFCFQ